MPKYAIFTAMFEPHYYALNLSKRDLGTYSISYEQFTSSIALSR